MSSITVYSSNLKSLNIKVSGYKHSLVVIIAATIIIQNAVKLSNVPDIEDTKVLTKILNYCGGQATFDNKVLSLNTSNLISAPMLPSLTKLIHGSLYLIPVFLGRFGKIQFGESGGCQIGASSSNGKRPVNHIVSILENFGGKFELSEETIIGRCEGFQACTIDIMNYSDKTDILTGPLVSGATKTAILAAMCVEKGETIIHNPYPKPDVTELLEFLKECGYSVKYNGQIAAISRGTANKSSPKKISYKMMSDISEIITYISCAVYNSVPLTLSGIDVAKIKTGLKEELKLLEQMGVNLKWGNNTLYIPVIEKLCSIDIDVTSVGIYSDHQPFFALMLLKGDAPATIREFVWKERFDYAKELVKLGAKILIKDNSITIYPSKLEKAGQLLYANDLRAASVLLIAALSIKGETRIENIYHLNRGYESLIDVFIKMGANIENN